MDTAEIPTNTFRQKESVEIIIETDNRYVRTSGYVESNEPNIFSSQEGCINLNHLS